MNTHLGDVRCGGNTEEVQPQTPNPQGEDKPMKKPRRQDQGGEPGE